MKTQISSPSGWWVVHTGAKFSDYSPEAHIWITQTPLSNI